MITIYSSLNKEHKHINQPLCFDIWFEMLHHWYSTIKTRTQRCIDDIHRSGLNFPRYASTSDNSFARYSRSDADHCTMNPLSVFI